MDRSLLLIGLCRERPTFARTSESDGRRFRCRRTAQKSNRSNREHRARHCALSVSLCDCGVENKSGRMLAPSKLEGNMSLETPEKPTAEHPSPESPNNKGRNQLLLLALSILVVGLVGALVWDFRQDANPGTEHNAVIGITIFIQAMITFFGILNLQEPHRTRVSPLTKGGMRAAIAGAVVVTYIFLVIFHTMVDFTVGSSPMRDSFVQSFTWVVNTTIIFYFASEATIHWINQSKPKGGSHHLSSPESAKGTETRLGNHR